MEEKMRIYNNMKEVPKEARKPITGGRLAGMTDIKPMWRIQKLTEEFGPAGIGWKTIIANKEIMEGANGEKIAIVDIDLFIKVDGEWSEAIPGTGGASFIAKEKNGLYTSDECYKMAYTDAISVACKSLGMGADVYWGDSKYATPGAEPTEDEAKEYVLQFGNKHKGEKLTDIITADPSYITWLVNNSNDEYLLKCIELLTGEKRLTEEEGKAKLKLLVTFEKLINETDTSKENLYAYYKVENNTQMTDEQLADAIAIMEKKKNEGK